MAARIARRRARAANPLRRRTDRIQARATALLVLLLLTAGPLLAGWAATTAYRADLRRHAWESRHRFAAEAVLFDEPAAAGSVPPAAAPGMPPAWWTAPDGAAASAPGGSPAWWTGPDGEIHTGRLRTLPGAAPGTRVPIWVTDRGELTGPPGPRDPVGRAVTAATAAVLSLAALLAAVRVLLVRMLDRRRLRQWENAWREVEPLWSRDR